MKYENLCINEKVLIRDAIKVLDETAKKILLVVDSENKLEGVITDGDIRRWILKNRSLEEPVSKIMNVTPICLNLSEKDIAKEIMKKNQIDAIPIINENNKIFDIVFWNDEFENILSRQQKIENPVVIMAGGKGTRLYPYTKILPKPLIPIGDTPIIERIIEKFLSYGCNKFYLTVNYKKNMIRAYFNELEKNYAVNYVEEERPLGTGGSLHLLKNKLDETFFVSNCDVLIDANYSDILKFHKKNKNKITVVTSLKNYTIPYGVLKLGEDGSVVNTIEKPEYNFLVNTGMYVLEPEVLNDIPENEFYHITKLIDEYLKVGKKVGTYPVTEKSWMDMGEFKEMERMVELLGV